MLGNSSGKLHNPLSPLKREAHGWPFLLLPRDTSFWRYRAKDAFPGPPGPIPRKPHLNGSTRSTGGGAPRRLLRLHPGGEAGVQGHRLRKHG